MRVVLTCRCPSTMRAMSHPTCSISRVAALLNGWTFAVLVDARSTTKTPVPPMCNALRDAPCQAGLTGCPSMTPNLP